MYKKIFSMFLFGIFLLIPKVAYAGYCFCATDLGAVNVSEISKVEKGGCEPTNSSENCMAISDQYFKGKCEFFAGTSSDDGSQACKDRATIWEKEKEKLSTGTENFTSSFRGVTSKLIPECLLKNNLSKDCRDVSIFVYFLIQVARYLFSVVGSLALIMFVYGGFTMILSQGNAEKVKKGTEIIVASVIGLVIMFGAYMLVSYLGDAVKIETQFKLK